MNGFSYAQNPETQRILCGSIAMVRQPIPISARAEICFLQPPVCLKGLTNCSYVN